MRRLLWLSALMLVSGFTSAVVVQAGSAPTRPIPSARNHPSDNDIERTLRFKLAKSKIGKDGFTVKVKNGVVFWEGTTNVMQHKGAATRMARAAGAIEVVNRIKISNEARRKAAGNLSGGIRRAQVKTN